MERLYDYYGNKFYLQQEALSKKNQLFDDDFLMFTIEKIIREKYDIMSLADPDFLREQMEDHYDKVSYKDKPLLLVRILKNINAYQQYQDTKNLEEIMEGTLFNVPFCLIECFTKDLKERHLTEEIIKNLADELAYFLDSYSISASDGLKLERIKNQLYRKINM